MELGDGIKKMLLAGIGTAATSFEKGQEILDKMVEKGELTVEQGKALNKELKHTMKSEKKEDTKEDSAEKSDKNSGTEKADQDDIAGKLAGMSKEELEELKAKIAEAEAAK